MPWLYASNISCHLHLFLLSSILGKLHFAIFASFSNNIFKDKHVHLDTLADELGTLDGEIQSIESEIDEQLEKSPTTFRLEDLDALAPNSNEPPTRLQRFLENAVVQKQLMLKAMERAEAVDGKTVNRNANSNSDSDSDSSDKSSSNTQNVSLNASARVSLC